MRADDLPIGRSFAFRAASATPRRHHRHHHCEEHAMPRLTGAQALIKSLEMESVEVVFGLPGGCILPAYDPLLESPIRHILVRHEQGAGHMAEGYAHVTGRPGVALVTSGPAATNLVTPLMDAYMDSIPMVAITGQVPTQRDRQRCLPGVRHGRHHPLGDEAQRVGDDARGAADGDPPGVPRRHDRPSGPGARRRPQGRAAGRDGVELADRRRRGRLVARLPADGQGSQPHDPRGGAPDPRRRTGRCCTSVAASSRRVPPTSCASSPS